MTARDAILNVYTVASDRKRVGRTRPVERLVRVMPCRSLVMPG
jgi:hypothetical protein